MDGETKAFLRIEKLTKGKVEGYNEWDEILLSTDAMLIGRPSKKPDAIQPDIEIIGDDYISRGENQTEIHYSLSDGCYMIRDNGSTNGTFINGELLEKDKFYHLKDNDLIGLAQVEGKIRVVFRFRESEKTLGPWDVERWGKLPQETGLAINLKARRVFVNGKEVSLTKKEFQVMEVLYDNRGKVCTKEDIAFWVWGREGASDELIAKHISRLRKQIEPDSSKPRYIVTVHDSYRLDL